MNEGGLNLRPKDEQRIEVLIRIEAGFLGMSEGAAVMGLSERQVRRLLTAYRAEGPRGLYTETAVSGQLTPFRMSYGSASVPLPGGSMPGSTTPTWRSSSVNGRGSPSPAPLFRTCSVRPASAHPGPRSAAPGTVPAGNVTPRRGCCCR